MENDDGLLDHKREHKREGWEERMYEQAEMLRKAAKEERLLEQHEAAINQEEK